MDRPLPVQVQRHRRLRWLAATLVGALVMYAGWRAIDRDSSIELSRAALAFGKTTQGPFQLGVSFVATVEPIRKLVLASSVGGTVKQVPVVSGSRLQAGALIAELSNPQIELELLARESEVAQQVSNLNSQRVQDQQNAFNYARQLSMARVDLANAESLAARNDELFAAGMISTAVVERSRRDLALSKNQVDLLSKSLADFESLSKQGLSELRGSVAQLRRGLQLSRSVSLQMEVRSPISGVLISLTAEKGQHLAAGTTIGVVGDDSELKLSARLDEFYLDKVRVGQRGQANIGGRSWEVEVSRVVGSVTDRKFLVELVPVELLQRATLGQSVPTSVTLSDAQPALKLPVGPYLSDASTHGVFVVSKDGQKATRRPIRFGERNEREVVVLSGLSPGDVVLISSYRDLLNYERIDFK